MIKVPATLKIIAIYTGDISENIVSDNTSANKAPKVIQAKEK